MKAKINLLLFILCTVLFSCCKEDSTTDIIPESDISEEIVGEWVYDNPEENVWQSMKFVAEGSFFCYSDNKSNWTERLKRINEGSYGVKGLVISGANGTTYLDMTVSKINGYQFTGRLNETTVDFTFHKVVRRIHLNFGESFQPEYEELVDAKIIGYKSHDEGIAVIDEATGEITAMANNGRTYVDIITESGTAVVKVMVGKINDGDEEEISPIGKKNVGTINDPSLNLSKAIIGKWIWDASYWEEMNFLENGKIYYSNIDVARGIYNENASGDYTIDDDNDRITLKVVPNGGTQMTVIMEMKAINKFSFTAKFYLTNGETTGTFTYARQIDSIELGDDETRQPDYKSIVGEGTIITGYKSHNSKIVEVDSATGELTAKMGGKTYVDIVTDEGTAVIEVFVKNFMEFNYEDFIGINKQGVTNTFGTLYTTSGNYIKYDYRKGSNADKQGKILDSHWDQISFLFDSKTSLVKTISLTARKDVWFTPEEMTEFLSHKYHYNENGSSGDIKAFTNKEKIEEATVGIAWDTANGLLTFEKIDSNADIISNYESKNGEYSSLLGKDKSTIVGKLGNNAFYATSTDLWYLGEDVNAMDYKYVIFSLDEPTTRAYSISLYLSENPNFEEVKEYLTAKFHVYEKGTNSEQLAFIDGEEVSNSTMGITVDLVNGLITYVDLSYSYGGSGYGAKATTRSRAHSTFFSNPSAFTPNLKKVLKYAK